MRDIAVSKRPYDGLAAVLVDTQFDTTWTQADFYPYARVFLGLQALPDDGGTWLTTEWDSHQAMAERHVGENDEVIARGHDDDIPLPGHVTPLVAADRHVVRAGGRISAWQSRQDHSTRWVFVGIEQTSPSERTPCLTRSTQPDFGGSYLAMKARANGIGRSQMRAASTDWPPDRFEREMICQLISGFMEEYCRSMLTPC